MPNVNYYLKQPNPTSGKSLIYLQMKFNKLRLVYSFGQAINPENWNYKKQRIKSNMDTSMEGNIFINDLLDNLAKVCLAAYHKEVSKGGTPSIEQIKSDLDCFFNKEQASSAEDKHDLSFFSLMDRFCAGEILSNGRPKAESTIEKYCVTRKHLKDFQNDCDYEITFESINLNFFYKFTGYLKTKKKLAHNTVAKDIAIIKVVCGEGLDLGYTQNRIFKNKKFSMNEVEVESVALTEVEIITIYNANLSSCPRLEKVRDLFVLGCFTGLRFSDYSNIKQENVVKIEGRVFIQMVTKKTGEKVIIPAHEITLAILKRYDDGEKLPRFSSQKFNLYLKEMLRKIDFTEKGRSISEPQKMLWELVSSHTARRTFITMCYLQGFPVNDLQKISGHRSSRTLERYLKISKLDTAKRLEKHMDNMWENKTKLMVLKTSESILHLN